MIAIKFDEDKAKKCIDAYYDMHKECPYLICNDETEKILQHTDTMTISATTYVCSVSNKDLIIENPSKPRIKRWNGAKVLIDNELKFGEVYIR